MTGSWTLDILVALEVRLVMYLINDGDSKINSNSIMLNDDSKIMHNAILWQVTNVLDKSRRLCLRSWSLQVLR